MLVYNPGRQPFETPGRVLCRIKVYLNFNLCLWTEIGALAHFGKARHLLTHYCMMAFFRDVLRCSLREALIIYRLIDATLIGNFFDGPFLN